MTELSYNQIVSKIKNDDSIDFVAFARTPWHAIGVSAVLASLHAENCAKKGIIILLYNDNEAKKAIINSANFTVSSDIDCSFYYDGSMDFPKSKRELLRLKSSYLNIFSKCHTGKTLYLINPMKPALHFCARLYTKVNHKKIINITFDEGLGQYIRSPLGWANQKFFETKNVKKYIQSLFSNIPERYFLHNLKKNNELIDFSLFDRKNPHLISNERSQSYYKNIITSAKIKGDYSNYENAVVISLQLYHETNEIKNDADLALLSSICKKLKKQNLKVILKPHPREKDLSRYNILDVEVDSENQNSLESILSTLTQMPICVLSFTSTCLITSKLFFDVNTVSMCRLIKSDLLTDSLKNEFSHFCKAFDCSVKIPTTNDEIISLITGELQ